MHKYFHGVLITATILAAIPAFAEPQVLKGHVPAAVAKGLAATGRLPASQQLHLAIGLPLRDTPALTTLLQQLYDPASPHYHQYLKPEQFTAGFGPTEKDYQALRHFAESHGLTVTGTHPNRMLLDVTGAVADVEQAFHVHLGVYPHPTEARTFYAPDVEPTLDLDVPVLHIAGLSDFARLHPTSLHARPTARLANTTPNVPGSEGGLYVGLDFRAAYAPGVTLDGTGQSVALVEFDTYYSSDISDYLGLASSGLAAGTNVNVIPVGVDESTNTTPGDGNLEVALDIDMAISMAPGLSSVMVYEAPNSDQGQDDMFNRIATDNLSRQISDSWSGATDAAVHQALMEFAAQGQSFFIASGDSGAYINPQSPPAPPTDDDYVTSVGGTTLTTTAARGGWASETAWNWSITEPPKTNGSSGGISPTFAIPSWQQSVSMTANQGSTTFRNIPDVALTADEIYIFANDGIGYTIGGTSAAAPLWAGFMALVNQQNAAVGNPSAGFFNPALYAIAQSADYSACFHDITTGNNTNLVSSNSYFAVPGYDLCTGWGTPAGSNLINVLTTPLDVFEITPSQGFSVSATAGGPVKSVSQNFLLTNTGTAALDWTLTNTSAWLDASSCSGTLPVGGFTNVTVNVNAATAASLPAGVYTTNVWFTNASDGVAQSRQFTLTLAPPQLVQNGGFETGDFTGWTLAGDGGMTNLVSSTYSFFSFGSYYVHSGNYAAFLGEPAIMAGLSQTVATIPGQAYLLSFWVANPGVFAYPLPPFPNEFMVAWNGSTLFDQINMEVFSYTNMLYVVSATNTSTMLSFGAENDNDYFGLDDVSVTPIPPPLFQSAASAKGSFILTWAAVTGVPYQLQYTTSLTTPNWINLGTPITASGDAISAPDVLPSDPQRFYRVVLVQ